MNARVDATAAAHTLRSGGVIAYPTEAVWGLGCDPFDEGAVTRLLALVRSTAVVVREGREREVPVETVVPGDIVRLRAVCADRHGGR